MLIVTDQYEPMVGGVPAVTRDLARGLAGRGHDVRVVAPSPSGLSWTHGGRVEAVPAGADRDGQLTVIRRGSVSWPWYDGQRLGFLRPAQARDLVAGLMPDAVHVHSPLTLGVAVAAAARRARLPVIYTNHYLPANVWPGIAASPARSAGSGVLDAAFYGYVTRFANRCDYVTAPTATALRLLREHGLRAASEAVSNGIDLDVFAPGPDTGTGLRARYDLPADRPLILAAGRLSPEKSADVLIEAMTLLPGPAQAGPVLAFAGTGPDERRLRELAARSGARDRVRFLGFVPGDDLPGLYRLADVFAIASPAELQSLVTMEAMASGLPVVAVNAGALPELVHTGENGFLTRPGRPGEVAECLGLLCRDPALRARMGRASLRIIADHDRYRAFARWESIYTSAEQDRRR